MKTRKPGVHLPGDPNPEYVDSPATRKLTAELESRQAMQEKRKALIARGEEIEAEAKANNRELSPIELRELETTLDAVEALDSVLNAPQPRRVSPSGFTPPDSARSWTHAPTGMNPRSYASLFGAELRDGGFESLNEFLASIHLGHADARLFSPFMASGHTLGSPSGGGFLVPTEFAADLLDAAIEGEIVRPRASVTGMMSDSKKVAGWDVSDHSTGALFGGFSGEWLAEGETATKQKGKMRLLELRAKSLACYTKSSNELLADGTTFEAMLGQALIRAIGWHLDHAFLQGNGAGQPLGVLNDPALVTVNKETAQNAATIVYGNLVKMFARLHPASVKNSVWVCNSTAIPQLLTLVIQIGTAGTHIPVLQETGDGAFQMLTRPVLFTEKLPQLGTVGDIILADFSQYQIGLRQEIVIEKTNAVGWTERETDWRAIVRADGMGRWNKAFTPKNGDSLSWCVALQTRS